MSLFYYNSQSCIGTAEICFSSETQYSAGQVVTFLDGELNPVFGCFTILGETEPCESIYTVDLTYEECLECLLDLMGGVFNFTSCVDESSYYIPSSAWTFNFVPQLRTYYSIETNEPREPSTLLCYTFSSFSDTPGGDLLNFATVNETAYSECIFCENSLPTTANTESFICQQICDESGTTVTSVSPPHPIWTSEFGAEITQANMITLGGTNGLNA